MKLLLLLLPLAVSPLAAQTAIPNGSPASNVFDGRVDEWTALPPTFHPSQTGGRQGAIWIRQLPEGLIVAGAVDGPAPDFASSSADSTNKERVEIWLAPPSQPPFPPIGNGFQSQEVPAIEDCKDDAKCREWFQSVVIHRGLMAQTFVRQYRMNPSFVSELFAKAAYDQMLIPVESGLLEHVTAVAPTGAPVFRFALGAAGGYSFEALVPWEAFPPFASLQLTKFQIMVDVFSNQQYSSTSSARKHGDPSSFNAVALEAGRQFRITACGYPLEGRNELRESGPALFFPQRDDNVMRVFRLRNFDTRYSYYLSPIAEVTNFAEKPMPGDATVCGPRLAIARNGAVQRFAPDVDPATLDVKPEPDGSFLVLSGPAWRRATKRDESGCCEGLPMIDFHAWLLSPAEKLREIFEFHVIMSGVAMGIVDMDVEVSPDAKKITTFVAMFSQMDKEEPWSSDTYCRQGMAYRKCGAKSEVKHAQRKAQ